VAPAVIVFCTDRGRHRRRVLLDVPGLGDETWRLLAEVRTSGERGGPALDLRTPARVTCPTCGRQVNRTWAQLRAAAQVVTELDVSAA
jgi:hypothetical protein